MGAGHLQAAETIKTGGYEDMGPVEIVACKRFWRPLFSPEPQKKAQTPVLNRIERR
jgi:hypothetical protein